MAFDQSPGIPPEISNAAASGELVVFVGAGISRLVKCPSWDQFADRVLDQLVAAEPRALNYYDLSQIQGIKDPKKRLSIAKIVAARKRVEIDYAKILNVKPSAPNVYTYLNSLNCSFVTTNYELLLAPKSTEATAEVEWRFFRRNQLLGVHLDRPGRVLHLHGCITEPETMVITTRDYLDHYSATEVQAFLRHLFERKTVLFLGYGLEEIEVLEYILRRGGATKADGRIRRFMLQGFFNAEEALFNSLHEFYLDSFSTELIGFPKDFRNYHQQAEVIEFWARKLTFGGVALTDEAAALEAEIRG